LPSPCLPGRHQRPSAQQPLRCLSSSPSRSEPCQRPCWHLHLPCVVRWPQRRSPSAECRWQQRRASPCQLGPDLLHGPCLGWLSPGLGRQCRKTLAGQPWHQTWLSPQRHGHSRTWSRSLRRRPAEPGLQHWRPTPWHPQLQRRLSACWPRQGLQPSQHLGLPSPCLPGRHQRPSAQQPLRCLSSSPSRSEPCQRPCWHLPQPCVVRWRRYQSLSVQCCWQQRKAPPCHSWRSLMPSVRPRRPSPECLRQLRRPWPGRSRRLRPFSLCLRSRYPCKLWKPFHLLDKPCLRLSRPLECSFRHLHECTLRLCPCRRRSSPQPGPSAGPGWRMLTRGHAGSTLWSRPFLPWLFQRQLADLPSLPPWLCCLSPGRTPWRSSPFAPEPLGGRWQRPRC